MTDTHSANIMTANIQTTSISTSNRQELRTQIRQWRRSLTPRQQREAACAWARQLLQLPEFISSRHIAFYWPQDGELNPFTLLETPLGQTKQFYLPVLHPWQSGRLCFTPYQMNMPCIPNRFGIPEPVNGFQHSAPTWCLDLVLTPLVGFDEQGSRLGMGGGFYDRTFSFLRRGFSKTKLIGVAYEEQKLDQLITHPWDIPLQAIVTNKKIYKCS